MEMSLVPNRSAPGSIHAAALLTGEHSTAASLKSTSTSSVASVPAQNVHAINGSVIRREASWERRYSLDFPAARDE